MSNQNLFFVLLCVLFSGILQAQEGTVIIQSEEKVKELLRLKKEINQRQNLVKIQIYSGSRQEAENLLSKFMVDFPDLRAKMVYETPSYKIWVGDYRSQIQADRDLIRIRKNYNRAFSFTPKATD